MTSGALEIVPLALVVLHSGFDNRRLVSAQKNKSFLETSALDCVYHLGLCRMSICWYALSISSS